MTELKTDCVLFREYYEKRLDEIEKRFALQLSASERALILSSSALEKRLEGMNEFRTQIKDERASFLPRSEYIIQHDKLADDVKDLQLSKAELAGKASQSSVNIAQVISIIAIAASFISLILRLIGL